MDKVRLLSLLSSLPSSPSHLCSPSFLSVPFTCSQISTAYWASPPTSLPRPTLSLLALANSPSGPFPPSSGLCLTIVPYSLLPAILDQYGPALDDVPAEVARALMRVHSSGSGSGSSPSTSQVDGQGNGESATLPAGQEKNGAERKKALRVRGRIDFRRWGFVKLEGEESVIAHTTAPSFASFGDAATDPARGPLGDPKSESAFMPTPATTATITTSSSTTSSSSPLASPPAIKPTPSFSSSSPSRPAPAPIRASSSSSSSGRGMFSHVDEKLAARKARRQIPVVSAAAKSSLSQGGGGLERATGFTGATVAEGTWFLVIVKRGLEGMEEAPGLERGVGTNGGGGAAGRRSEGVV